MAVSCLPVRAEQNVASTADATSASAAADLTGSVGPEPAAINHIVYLAKLPTPAELQKGAALQGAVVLRIDQTNDRMVVVYEYSGGRAVTFAFTLLSAAANYPAATVAPATSASGNAATVVYAQPASATQVVYAQPSTVYYTPRYVSYYDPAWDFWTPLALGVGIGLIGGHGHGWYGGHGWHGGWHR